MLEGEELEDDTVITGTINSGGLIGPVAGLEKKIDAALKHNFKKILIPKWQSDINSTAIGKNNPEISATIIKVKNLEEAVYHFTGMRTEKTEEELTVSEAYSEKMKEVADKLCIRAKSLMNKTEPGTSLYNLSKDFINKSKMAGQSHYSKASYCFSANLRLKELVLKEKTGEELLQMRNQTLEEYNSFEEEVRSRDKDTITKLQAYIIVMERLNQAKDSLDLIDKDNISANMLAYSSERLYSAKVWSEFFSIEGKEVMLDEEHLRDACLKKTAEAEERISYIELYVPPDFLEGMKQDLEEAFREFDRKDYSFCIFKAAKAKAEANMMLTVLTIKEEEMETVLREKLDAVRKIIIEQQQRELFPILGYSYYEYSKSLIEHDVLSSLTFTEYALEFSRLDLYFPLESRRSIDFDFSSFRIFLAGIIVGYLVFRLITRSKNPGRFQEKRNLPGKKR